MPFPTDGSCLSIMPRFYLHTLAGKDQKNHGQYVHGGLKVCLLVFAERRGHMADSGKEGSSQT